MSLLLDALKKAAEQKAQKSQSESSADRASDETLIDVAAASSSPSENADSSLLPGAGDETEFDQSELGVRLDRIGRERGVGDKTNLDLADATQTEVLKDLPTAGAGDKTDLDLADATQTEVLKDLPTAGAGDKTDLDLADATQTEILKDLPTAESDDKTNLDLADATQTEILKDLPTTESDDKTNLDLADATQTEIPRDLLTAGSGDETNLDLADATQTEIPRDLPTAGSHDETNLDLAGATQTDIDQNLEIGNSGGETGDDQTDISQPSAWADQIERAQAQQPPKEVLDVEKDSLTNRDAMDDEDLSLLLIEREETEPRLAAATSFTEPQNPQARNLALEDIASDKEELSLVDDTHSSIPAEQTDTQSSTLTSPTATAAVYGDETRTSHSAATRVRVDETSTRTYAPDNYDRTLMKLPSDDASNIFAGMKSAPDVVMTPDYAKKVFRSKTSAQRTQHYQLYLGILVIVALSIGIYGAFQYQDESDQIDASLRSLKRDPMPGVIKTAEPEKTALFAETEALSNARTVEIIAGANQPASLPVDEAATDQLEVAESVIEQPDLVSVAPNETAVIEPQAEAEQTPIPRTSTSPADVDQVASLDAQTTNEVYSNAAKNLQISSSNQYRETDVWLREAYSAYRSGDNELALRRYNQVLEVDSSNRNALLARAAIYMQNGNSDAAVRDYQALLLANPKDSMAMSSFLAVASISPQDTESQLKLMIRDDPQSPYLNFALANAYGAQKRWKDAQRHYFQALQNNPADPNYAYNLAVSLEHISQPGSAVTYYQRALDNYANGIATFSRDVVAQRMEVLGKL